MTRDEFAALHQGAQPLVLFNIWDAGSAKAVAEAGAKAIATGSLSLAGAQGFEDGEAITFADLLRTAAQISASTDLPLSVDIESGYADDLETLGTNARELTKLGVVGCNLEDRLIGSEALRDPAQQAERISVLADAGLFVNARTDLFLGPLMRGEDPNREELVEEALGRASAYADAGAGSFFVPGLNKRDLIAQVCERSPLPVNVMRLPGMATNAELAGLGVARISYGPGPWREAMAAVTQAAREAFT